MSPGPSLSPEEIIRAALVEYTNLTDQTLSQIKSCGSPPVIQIQQHDDDDDDVMLLMTRLQVIVDNLQALTPALSEFTGLQAASQPVPLVFSSINTLLAVAKSDAENFDPLLVLFRYVEDVLKRLKVYPEVSAMPRVTQTLVIIMTELVFVFGIATKDVKRGCPLRRYANQLRGGIDVEKILYRLDRLTPEEAQRTVTPTLEVIYGLVHNLTLVMEGEAASMEHIGRGLRDIQQTVTEIASVNCHAQQQDLTRWLSPPDPSTNHNIARKAHHDGTATWFIEGKTFKEWRTKGGLLLIFGEPGSGKSVLCSTIVHHTRLMCETGLATVGYFYVDFREWAKQDARGLLSSLLIQLCTQSDRFCETLSSLYARHDSGLEPPSEDALVQCLREMLEVPKRAPVFLVVDALDECPVSRGILTPRAQVLEIVKDLIKLKLPHLHFCITSRPEFDIREVLEPLESSRVSLHDQEGQIEDIAHYVRSVVLSDVKMREWPKEEKQLVIDTLTKRSGGTFRWAFCQLETLRRYPLQKIPSALGQLPKTLDETYERTLQDIHEEKWEFAYRIFQLLAVAVRPLHVQELAEIFAISIDEETTGIPGFNPRWRPQDAESAVLSACSSLIAVIDTYGQKQVQFSHFSVQEFLTSNRLRDQRSTHLSQYYVVPRPAHTFFAKACLSVLLQLTPRIHKNSVKGMFPLAPYAAEHWVGHAQRGDVSWLTGDGIGRLFEDTSHFAAWIWVFDIDNPSGPHMDSTTPEIPEIGPLYYAALCGFLDIVKRLVDSQPEGVNTRGHDGGTSLHAALRNGHSDVALLLLGRNADPNARDNRDETPLQVASRQGDVKAMKFLIDYQVNLCGKNGDKETALSLASRDGRLEAARLLLEHGADVDQQVSLGRTALHVASENGHNRIARLLLNNGANVNALERSLRTPLYLAVDQGKVEVARLLLQHGADVNVTEVSQLTPLHMASSGGQVGTTRLLLDFGADVNAEDGEGWTALHLAAYHGHLEVGKLLLARGATRDSMNHHGKTPFDVAVENHHTHVAESLAREFLEGLEQAYQEEHTLIISVG